MLNYKYTHTATEASTGYFTCLPSPELPLPDALAYVAAHPLDDFMRLHVLERLGAEPAEHIAGVVRSVWTQLPLPVVALLRELAVLRPSVAGLVAGLLDGKMEAADEASPFIFLRWQRLPDRELHAAWVALFDGNIRHHRALPRPEATGLAPLYEEVDGCWRNASAPFLNLGLAPAFIAPTSVALPDLAEPVRCGSLAPFRPGAEETSAQALERLEGCGIVQGREMRHIASLSPVGLLRPWRVGVRVEEGRHHYALEGEATAYGRGISLAGARASCLMEVVERASLYVSVNQGAVVDRLEDCPLLRGSCREMRERGYTVLDLDAFPVEVPPAEAPLYWVAGHCATGASVLVPLQMAALFCNLDEISLFEAPGSTGAATGNTLEEAKLAALLEILERHAEATTPFSKESCFTLASGDGFMANLLADYRARGIQVQFQDLTGPLGVPVFKCFVLSRKGHVSQGFGANLNAGNAIVSALTETPFPYPQGGPSGPHLRNLPQRLLEEMPNYSSSSPAENLALLENLLCANGREPVYVVMTHNRLLFPVVRAFVPGLETVADKSRFSRVPLALYRNYLRLSA